MRVVLPSLLRDRDFLDIRQQLAIHGAVNRLQRAGVVIHVRDDVHGRGLPSIGQDTALLDVPAIAFLLPRPLAKTTLRIEDPRANLLGRGIPTNDLQTGHLDAVANLDGEGARQ